MFKARTNGRKRFHLFETGDFKIKFSIKFKHDKFKHEKNMTLNNGMHSLNKLIAYINLTPTMYHKFTLSANGMNAYALNLNGKT